MDSQSVWIPYIITHCLTFLLIFICYKWPKTGKAAWGIIFVAAGIFNLYTVNSNPQAYIDYSQYAVGPYQKFISGIFSSYTSVFVSLIALGQILVGIFLLSKKRFFLWGIVGGIIFFIAISPLGIGSAFPSTLFMAISLIILYLRQKKATASLLS